MTNSLLLEYALGDERSYLWAVTPTTNDELMNCQAEPRSKRQPASSMGCSLHASANQEKLPGSIRRESVRPSRSTGNRRLL